MHAFAGLRRLPEFGFETPSSEAGLFGGVERFHQLELTGLRFRHVHVFWRDVGVEQRAKVPRPIPHNSAFCFEPAIEGRTWKRSQESDLDLIQGRVAHKRQHFVEYIWSIAI